MKVGCTSDSVDSGWEAAQVVDKHRILDSRFNGYTQRGRTSQSVEHGDGVCVSERRTHMPGLCTFSGWGIDTDALQAASLQHFTQCPGPAFECDGSSNVRELHHCNQRAAARRGELEHVEGRRASRIDTLSTFAAPNFPHFHISRFAALKCPQFQKHRGCKCGNVEMWKVRGCKCGNVEMWKVRGCRCGNVEMWNSVINAV